MQKTTCQSIRTSLIERREKHVKWKDIGKDYPGVPLGTLCRIAKDASYEPKDSALRIALGLHPIHVIIDPCAKCGKLHAFKSRCPDQPTAPRRKYDMSNREAREIGIGILALLHTSPVRTVTG